MIVDSRLSFARQLPSPNCSERPPGAVVDLLVIHNISLPPGCYGGGNIEALFDNRLAADAHPYFREIASLRVSAHLLIDREGAVTQFVPFDKKAWHAGQSSFRGREACNDFSVGIELEGCDQEPFTDRQYERLIEVSRLLMVAFPHITPDRIVGHSDIAPGRKTDPGPCFDWERLRAGCR
ncbi:MAG: 1,6-anhydro-N-acetylmuramyl-L-alanine amidase AmpD [Pseudomonadales bacterium]|nr:1,6-anhydro-N-acetylmuramyl-L-alanine amidase AmpD [Pseudomonadales bacterium]MCP5330836.1 1,6-anhydro-N-acetylmuramyl-L-alanine amidase AmpD [Pseudomonadales bacterium]